MRLRAVMLAAVMLIGCDRVFGLGDPYQDAMQSHDTMPVDGTTSVQFANAACTKDVGMQSFSIMLPNTATGDLLIVDITHGGPLVDSLLISDDHGNAFTQLAGLSFFQQARVYYLAGIPGGTTTVTVMPGSGSAVSPPYRACVTEYSGVGANPIAGYTTNRLSNGAPGPETVTVAEMLAVPDRGLIHVAAFDGRGVQLHGSLDVRGSSVVDAVAEDSAMTIDATTTLATLDSTALGIFVEWVAMAVAIQPR